MKEASLNNLITKKEELNKFPTEHDPEYQEIPHPEGMHYL
jgi:hypothetical protein